MIYSLMRVLYASSALCLYPYSSKTAGLQFLEEQRFELNGLVLEVFRWSCMAAAFRRLYNLISAIFSI